MDTYSTFCKDLIIPAISAITLTSAELSLDINNIDVFPCESVVICYDGEPYSSLDSGTNETVKIDNDFMDLLVIQSFAEKMLSGMKPVDQAIQSIIDDYFWEMI